MSDLTHIQARLLEFLRGEVFSPQTAVSGDTDLIASGFDSVSLVSLLLFIERTYGLWVPERETLAILLSALLGSIAQNSRRGHSYQRGSSR